MGASTAIAACDLLWWDNSAKFGKRAQGFGLHLAKFQPNQRACRMQANTGGERQGSRYSVGGKSGGQHCALGQKLRHAPATICANAACVCKPLR